MDKNQKTNIDWKYFIYNIKKDIKYWIRVENILLCGKFSVKVVENFSKVIVMY